VPLNLSFTHLLVVGFVALVVLGPERLPGVARTAGNLYREWQRISGGLQAEVRDVISEFTEPFAEPIQDIIRGPGGGTAPAAEAGSPAASVPAGNGDGARGAQAPLAVLPPLGVATAGPTPAPAGQEVIAPLAPAIPALGPSTGLLSPGPSLQAVLPALAPPADPRTFVPFTPGAAPAVDG